MEIDALDARILQYLQKTVVFQLRFWAKRLVCQGMLFGVVFVRWKTMVI